MSETSQNMEYKQVGAEHATAVRESIEQTVDTLQEVAQNIGDYVTSFWSTLTK